MEYFSKRSPPLKKWREIFFISMRNTTKYSAAFPHIVQFFFPVDGRRFFCLLLNYFPVLCVFWIFGEICLKQDDFSDALNYAV